MVRARFAAFALGDGAFLWRTLDPDHALRAEPEDRTVRSLSRAHQELRYRDVEVRDDAVDGERGEALFRANIFQRGKDRSFVERSRFTWRGGWRYLDGDLVRLGEPGADAPTLEAFRRALGGE